VEISDIRVVSWLIALSDRWIAPVHYGKLIDIWFKRVLEEDVVVIAV